MSGSWGTVNGFSGLPGKAPKAKKKSSGADQGACVLAARAKGGVASEIVDSLFSGR
jgi:hypothetical protein